MKKRISENNVLRTIVRYFMIILGSSLYAAGFQLFMYPNSIVTGGVMGISQIINHFTQLPIGALTIIMNVPLFIFAWKHFGLDFMLASLAGMFFSSAAVDVFAATNIALTDDMMLAAIVGGAIKGAGQGLVFYVSATTGGIDIVAKILRKRYAHINFGTIVLLIDACIIGIYALVMGNYETCMYAIISMFAASKFIDLVVYGFDNSSICYIISEKSETIAKDIISGHLRRGVTILNGQGAYSHQDKKVIMCVIKRTQIGELKKLLKAVDENAFVVVSDANNVFGNGFDNISEVK